MRRIKGSGLFSKTPDPFIAVQYNLAGVPVAVTWGYIVLLREVLPAIDGNFTYASSSKTPNHSWGEPPHDISHNPAAESYQRRIAETFGDKPPHPNWEFKLDDRWFDGFNSSQKKLLDAKGRSYERLIKELVDQRNITAVWDKLVKELEVQVGIARSNGYTLDWHIKEKFVVDRVDGYATKEGLDDVLSVIHTP